MMLTLQLCENLARAIGRIIIDADQFQWQCDGEHALEYRP
jgi:hypothetical protein